MTNNENQEDQNFTKEYTRMSVSAIGPIALLMIAEAISCKTKVGANILYTLSALSALYTAKVFYSAFKNNSR